MMVYHLAAAAAALFAEPEIVLARPGQSPVDRKRIENVRSCYRPHQGARECARRRRRSEAVTA